MQCLVLGPEPPLSTNCFPAGTRLLTFQEILEIAFLVWNSLVCILCLWANAPDQCRTFAFNKWIRADPSHDSSLPVLYLVWSPHATLPAKDYTTCVCVIDEDRVARWYERWWRGLTRQLYQKAEREQKRHLLKKTVLTGLSSAIRITPNVFSQQDSFNLIYVGEKVHKRKLSPFSSCQLKVYTKRHLGTKIELKHQVPGAFYYRCSGSSFVHSIPNYWYFHEPATEPGVGRLKLLMCKRLTLYNTFGYNTMKTAMKNLYATTKPGSSPQLE